jgi:hypothetical membrane protein
MDTLPLHRLSILAGWFGVVLIVSGTSIALLRYQGSFSLLNLTISELGLPSDSPAADIFNGGLIGGGACLAVFLVGLSVHLGGLTGLLLAFLGASTGVATALVGVFPVDHALHQVVGPACVVSGLLSSLLFAGYSLLRGDSATPRWLALPSLLASGCLGLYISMPLLLPDGFNQIFAAPDVATRPAVWIVAISEWAALGAVLVWVSVVAWQRTCLAWPDIPR